MALKKGTHRPIFTAEQFITAMPDSGGIVTLIAKRVGCDWHTARKWIDTHPSILQAWQDARESVSDLAESKLIENIKSSDMGAIKYWLSTQGKSRGYVERQEIRIGEDSTLTITERIVDATDRETPDGGVIPATGAVST